MTDLEALAASPRAGILNAVIEIPAGTVEKRQYDPATNTFPIDLRNGQPRLIRFLPYPANYGFIPGTRRVRAVRCGAQRHGDGGGAHRHH